MIWFPSVKKFINVIKMPKLRKINTLIERRLKLITLISKVNFWVSNRNDLTTFHFIHDNLEQKWLRKISNATLYISGYTKWDD